MSWNKLLLLTFILTRSTNIWSQTDSFDIKKIFQKVDVEASYPGGSEAWIKFLQTNLDAGTPVKNGAPAGTYTIWVQFVVDKDGTISEIETLTKFGYGMEAEVTRIIKRSGKWKPARQGEKPVRAYRKQPVTFVVIDEGYDIKTKTPNTLYAGIDNEINIEVPKVKNQDLQVTISQGRIIRGADGKFIARVTKPGRVIIEIFNIRKDKKIGAVSFEVLNPEN